MNILIVDDSITYRSTVKSLINETGLATDIQVASNGKIGIEFLNSKKFDLIILDLEMPLVDGFGVLDFITKEKIKTPVIVFASPTELGASKALDALKKGASDFVPKPQGTTDSLSQIRMDLIPKVTAFLNIVKNRESSAPKSVTPIVKEPKIEKTSIIRLKSRSKFLCIGSSTGGPDALRKVFSHLKSPPKVPVLMVQHMPPIFTKQFAGMLSKLSGLNVVEATHGMKVEKGTFYLAPGDFHMTLENNKGQYVIHLNQADKVCYVRPAFDVLLNSLAKLNERETTVIVLTGMGEDGKAGLKNLKTEKTHVAIQSKESSVVWGMPGAVHAENLHDEVLELEEISALIQKIGEF